MLGTLRTKHFADSCMRNKHVYKYSNYQNYNENMYQRGVSMTQSLIIEFVTPKRTMES